MHSKTSVKESLPVVSFTDSSLNNKAHSRGAAFQLLDADIDEVKQSGLTVCHQRRQLKVQLYHVHLNTAGSGAVTHKSYVIITYTNHNIPEIMFSTLKPKHNYITLEHVFQARA